MIKPIRVLGSGMAGNENGNGNQYLNGNGNYQMGLGGIGIEIAFPLTSGLQVDTTARVFQFISRAAAL